jgi:FkbM family methyltransferase
LRYNYNLLSGKIKAQTYRHAEFSLKNQTCLFQHPPFMEVQKLNLFGQKFSFYNRFEFLLLYKDEFIFQDYKFKTKNKTPFIIDCGGHIGTTALYFKKKYPNAKLFIFEPSPIPLKLLRLNVAQNKYKDIKIVQAAVGSKTGAISFYIRKDPEKESWGDTTNIKMRYNPEEYKKISVKSVRLSKYIDKPVDLLKLDIEGMEAQVLKEIEKKLHFVENLIIEYHGDVTNKFNKVEDIIKILEENGFTYKIKLTSKLAFWKSPTLKEVKKQKLNLFLIVAKRI